MAMEVESLMILVAAFCGVCAILWWRWRVKNKARPPGPRSIPLLGHLHLLMKRGAAPHTVLQGLSSCFGPIVFLRFGTVPVVLASTRESAREFLKIHDAVFASRPLLAAGRWLTYNYSDLVFVPYGERWRQLRRLSTLELFTVRRIEQFEGLRMDEVRSLLQSLLSVAPAGEVVVDMRAKLTELTFNLITQMLMSKRYFGQNAGDAKEADAFTHVISEVFELCGAFPLGDYFPLLRWIDPVVARLKACSKSVDAFLEPIISQRETKRKESLIPDVEVPMDFLDVLLELRDKGEQCLQGNTLKALMLNMITAGTDTSAVTLEWALAELIKHPSIMAKAQEEMNRVVGPDRLVEESDLSQLTYLHAIVKETFRLHSPVPLLLPHESMETCEVMGYRMPRGTMLLVNAYAIGRDASVWDNPLEFRAERFLGCETDVRGHDFDLIPFGSGRRMCPGLSLALTTVHLTLANLVHGFEWRMPPGEAVDTVTEQYGLTLLMGNKLQAIPIARLPSETYTGGRTVELDHTKPQLPGGEIHLV